MEKILSWTNFYNHPRFWRHFLPWLFIFAFLYISIYFVGRSEGDQPLEAPQTVFLVIGEILFLIYGSFYAYNVLYKKWKKKALFILVVIGVVLVTATVDHILNTKVVQMGAIQGFWADVVLFPVIVLVAFGLKLSYHGTRQMFVIEKLEAKQLESELKLLKSQVNPHFLFNTLNNIYSTNLEDSEKANEIILELSDLLRYQLESHKKTYTPLSTEIKNIENYIDLERIRVRDCNIDIEKKGHFDNFEIVPLLLLPFVENAFKYGTGIEPGLIKISIEMKESGLFHFYISNKIVQKKGKIHSGGIGLENVKKRLQLMYPQKHTLDLQELEMEYIVNLKVQL